MYTVDIISDARLLMYSKLTDEEVDDLRAYVPKPVLYKVRRNVFRHWRKLYSVLARMVNVSFVCVFRLELLAFSANEMCEIWPEKLCKTYFARGNLCQFEKTLHFESLYDVFLSPLSSTFCRVS